MPEYREYAAWDVPTRLFHWINALAVFGLLVTGLDILLDNLFHHSPSGKVTLKDFHVVFGYLMAANLVWRFVWAFVGNRYARWRSIVPGGPGYLMALRAYTASFLAGEPQRIAFTRRETTDVVFGVRVGREQHVAALPRARRQQFFELEQRQRTVQPAGVHRRECGRSGRVVQGICPLVPITNSIASRARRG